jgi:hypothetical protein
MASSLSVAASLPHEIRKHFAIHALAGSEPISRAAEREHVSRKFICHQKHKAEAALDQALSPPSEASDVIFHLPATGAWLSQLVLCLVLVCHSSLRGVVRLLQDMFDTTISVGTVHSRLAAAASCAAQINAGQDLSLSALGSATKSSKEAGRSWRASMRLPPIATFWLRPNTVTATPGACICWMPRRKG